MKILLKERSGGLFLLVLAVTIFFSLNILSTKADLKEKEQSISSNLDTDSLSDNGQVLGQLDEASEVYIENNNENNIQETEEKIQNNEEIGKNISDDEYYTDLKNRLKKYCDSKSFNVKKCHDYLIEAKNKIKKGDRFKKLYEKYHFEKKEDEKNEIPVIATAETKFSLTITSDSSKKYEISASKDNSVLDLMDLLQKDSSHNFSYHSSSGFVDKINDIGSSGNMSWMLYVCKGDICKLANVGASDVKIGDWDKIEWKYVDWTALTWETW